MADGRFSRWGRVVDRRRTGRLVAAYGRFGGEEWWSFGGGRAVGRRGKVVGWRRAGGLVAREGGPLAVGGRFGGEGGWSVGGGRAVW